MRPSALPPWAEPLLAAVAGGATISRAAQAAGVGHTAVHQLAARNAVFAERLEAARKQQASSPGRWPGWAQPVLEAIAAGAGVVAAAQGAQVSHAAVHQLASRNQAFAAALAAARRPRRIVPNRATSHASAQLLRADDGDGGPVGLLIDLVRLAWSDAAAGDVDAQAWLTELLGRPVAPEEAATRAGRLVKV